MIIELDTGVKAYLEKVGTKRLLIDMTPDMTNSGCGCGKTKKYYIPYIRALKSNEQVAGFKHFEIDQVDIYLSPGAIHAAEERIKIKLEKNLFVKKLALEGIRFIVE